MAPYSTATPVIFVLFDSGEVLHELGVLGIVLRSEFPSSAFVDVRRSRVGNVARGILKVTQEGVGQPSLRDMEAAMGLPLEGHHNAGNSAVLELLAFLADLSIPWADTTGVAAVEDAGLQGPEYGSG
jgi:hypothetical protein